jgi:hypothetical protein
MTDHHLDHTPGTDTPGPDTPRPDSPVDGAVPTGRERRVARGSIIVILATGLGIFMLGFPAGVLPALATVVFFLAPQETSRAASLAALVLLAVAGVATLAEGSLRAEDLSLRYANEREIATTAAAAAGGLLGIAVLTGSIIERSPVPAPRWQRRPRPLPRQSTSRRSGHGPLLVSLAVGATVRLVLAPGAFGEDGRLAASNLANGVAYHNHLADGVLVPPLAPALSIGLPVGDRLLLVLVGLATIATAIRLADRLLVDAHPPLRRRATWCAGLIAALLPALVTQRLPEALATLLVTLAVILAWPDRATPTRILGAGAVLGLAATAEPTALLAAGALAAWVATSRTPDRTTYALLLLVPLVLVLAPLVQWTMATLGSPWPRSPADGGSVTGSVRLLAVGLDGIAGAACFLGRDRTTTPNRRDAILFVGLPTLALLSGALTGSSSGLWGWSSGVVAVGAGLALTSRVGHGAASPAVEPEDRVDLVSGVDE